MNCVIVFVVAMRKTCSFSADLRGSNTKLLSTTFSQLYQ